MFGLGFVEILILALIAFLVFGPEQFPVAAKNFIKLLNELRQAFTDVKSSFDDTQTSAEKRLREITNLADKDIEPIKSALKKEWADFNLESAPKDKKGQPENESRGAEDSPAGDCSKNKNSESKSQPKKISKNRA